MRKRILAALLALSCVTAGVAALLLAADVAAVRASLANDDVSYRTAPEGGALWSPEPRVPGDAATRLLGVRDDLLFRRALRAARLSHPELPGFSDPSYVLHRNDASAWLVDVLQHDESLGRRSAAANLLGVLSFADAIADYQNRAKLLEAAGGRFRQAVSFDPTNEDAKVNLELTLSRSRDFELSEAGGGTDPSPGGRGARGAGAGDAGSGY